MLSVRKPNSEETLLPPALISTIAGAAAGAPACVANVTLPLCSLQRTPAGHPLALLQLEWRAPPIPERSAGAGLATSFPLYPLETARTRMTVDGEVYKTLGQTFRTIVSQEGFGALYRARLPLLAACSSQSSGPAATPHASCRGLPLALLLTWVWPAGLQHLPHRRSALRLHTPGAVRQPQVCVQEGAPPGPARCRRPLCASSTGAQLRPLEAICSLRWAQAACTARPMAMHAFRLT